MTLFYSQTMSPKHYIFATTLRSKLGQENGWLRLFMVELEFEPVLSPANTTHWSCQVADIGAKLQFDLLQL